MSALDTAIDNMSAAQYLPLAPAGGTAQCPLGDVRIGVFFDGTGNSKWVDAHDPYSGKQSGELFGPGAWSNVALLWELYQGVEGDNVFSKIYHHGPGTDSTAPVGEGSDERYPDFAGTAFGNGGKARVRWGLAQLAEFYSLNELAVNKYFDTYGFSRGAAIARDFVNSVRTVGIDNYNKPDGWRVRLVNGFAVLERNYTRHIGLIPTFLGIFDTVASFGTAGAEPGNWMSGYDFSVDHTWVKRTVHLIAEDETRMNFPLSSLFMDPNDDGLEGWWPPSQKPSDYSKTMIELWYPGAHSDVGGGYLVEEHDTTPTIWPDLSKIPLCDMHKASVRAGVPMNALSAPLPTDLAEQYGAYLGYRGGKPYDIGQKYIHSFVHLEFWYWYYHEREKQACIIDLKQSYIHDSRLSIDKLVHEQQRSVHFMGPQPKKA